jgi:hypothetical protein
MAGSGATRRGARLLVVVWRPARWGRRRRRLLDGEAVVRLVRGGLRQAPWWRVSPQWWLGGRRRGFPWLGLGGRRAAPCNGGVRMSVALSLVVGTISGSLWRGCRRRATGFGDLRRQTVSPMGGEGGDQASQISGVVAYIMVGGDMDGGGLLLDVGTWRLPCPDKVPGRFWSLVAAPSASFRGGLWWLATSVGLAITCGPISWPKCSRGPLACSAMSVVVG